MRYITFKENCRFKRWTPVLAAILDALHQIQQNPTIPNLVVTSVNDSSHSKVPLSKHYTDEALDIRTHNFTDMIHKRTFINQLSALLNNRPKPDCFTILHENIGTPNEHIHCQLKIGKTYDS